jgi:hypothetical protein
VNGAGSDLLVSQSNKRISIVQEILRQWDPIGVRPGEGAPADEYDSYAPHLVSMVRRNCSVDQLCGALENIRVQTLGVGADPTRDRGLVNQSSR